VAAPEFPSSTLREVIDELLEVRQTESAFYRFSFFRRPVVELLGRETERERDREARRVATR